MRRLLVVATVAVERSVVESQNVAGLLRGADPRLRNEYVVLSAHLDHLGVGEPTNGDRINNGAMDNAAGVAAILEIAAALAVQADPEPHRNRFVRSDQYSFVRAGIPALAMKVGYLENTPEAAIARKWTAERYHALSDDLAQPIDLSAAQTFVTVVRELALRVANRSGRLRWTESSFFKRFVRDIPS